MTLERTGRQRCQRCTRPLAHCLCSLIPHLPSQTRILLVQHPDEVKHALNTARFVSLGLQNAELIIAETIADLQQYLQQPGYRACVLFPGEEAQELTAYQANQLPLLLVVPDGTWRKARKILYCNPLLAELPRVTLPAGLRSRYRLRKALSAEALATVEAVSCALSILEPDADFSALLRPFEALIEGQIEAMGAEVYQRNHVD
ncbi:tRNA-uridine aminocarboxypropyltransferase [Denitrificimonas caeni]|uniref:tRNA-uridine aminocarboxypropyltransferase n=1 Tax=Denitrificimonas caeni TaxID=521720 RepID=UPI001964CB4D|nr:DTW domain-containing protein [Denitrificimonas caeni]